MQFKRLDLAAVSFRECKAVTEQAMKVRLTKLTGALYSGCVAGAITTYTRPFMAAEGLGSLNKKYSVGFENEEMQSTHDDLIKNRNTIFAHRDLVAAKSFVLKPGSHPVTYESRIIISPSPSGKGASIKSVPALLYLDESSLPGIIELCDFQIARASKEVRALLKDMAGEKVYRPGLYVVGDNFP